MLLISKTVKTLRCLLHENFNNNNNNNNNNKEVENNVTY